MRKIDISVVAAQYAARIYLEVPGYTKEKAKQIFKQWYSLVERYLSKMQDADTDYEKYNLRFSANIFIEAKLNLQLSALNAMKELRQFSFDYHIAECELNEAENFDEANKAFQKLLKIDTARMTAKIRFLESVAKEFNQLSKAVSDYSKEWNAIKKERKSTTMQITNLNRSLDSTYNPTEIRSKKDKLDELIIDKTQLLEDQYNLELYVDSAIDTSIEVINGSLPENNLYTVNADVSCTAYNKKEIRRAYRKGVL